MSQTIEELKNRLAVLERKAAREKKARFLAEQQLEKYSQEIYETNQSLQVSLVQAKKKQSELEYLAKTSADVSSDISLKELMTDTVELTGQFFSAECGFYLISKEGQLADKELDRVWHKDKNWIKDPALILEVLEILPLNCNEVFESWLISPLELADNGELSRFRWTVYANFALLNGQFAWIVFFTNHEYLDEEALFVLDTVKGHLSSGIRRRLTDVQILKRTGQLQDSVNSLEQAKRQLIQSEKMASLGQLAAGVAHEINNPVGFIRSNLEMLKDYLQDYKALHDEMNIALQNDKTIEFSHYKELCKKFDLAYIEEDSGDLLASNIEGLERIKDIVDGLKTFSHSGDQQLTPVSLFECIDSALNISANALKYEHKVDNQVTEQVALIMGNVGHLQQVFVNLFVNAAYAMGRGGVLTISSKQEGQSLAILVSDTGCGMDQKAISNLFTPFFTTKPVGVGTGLGLSVSYSILEAHNAEVVVDSKLGVGTTFNISFPMLVD